VLAMFSARVQSVVALVAGIAGALTAYLVAYHSSIGFMWPSTFGLAATLTVGAALSLVAPAPAASVGRALTWWSVMARPPSRTAESAL
jgi:hypothetical protein